MADTNINLLHYNSCHYAQEFFHTLHSPGLSPTIDKPTRVHRSSASLIDNIFTNKVDNDIISGNLITDISDQFTQFCISSTHVTKGKLDRPLFRDYNPFSEEKFIDDVAHIRWQTTISEDETNVDKMFSSFYNKLNKVVNKHAPLKPISLRKAKSFSKPWITSGIRKSIQIKNKLLTGGNKDLYKLYRNNILKLTRLSKKLHFHNYFRLNMNSLNEHGTA